MDGLAISFVRLGSTGLTRSLCLVQCFIGHQQQFFRRAICSGTMEVTPILTDTEITGEIHEVYLNLNPFKTLSAIVMLRLSLLPA